MFYEVKVTDKKLEELRMLMDWQLEEMGFDPKSINLACENKKCSEFDRIFRKYYRQAFLGITTLLENKKVTENTTVIELSIIIKNLLDDHDNPVYQHIEDQYCPE